MPKFVRDVIQNLKWVVTTQDFQIKGLNII